MGFYYTSSVLHPSLHRSQRRPWKVHSTLNCRWTPHKLVWVFNSSEAQFYFRWRFPLEILKLPPCWLCLRGLVLWLLMIIYTCFLLSFIVGLIKTDIAKEAVFQEQRKSWTLFILFKDFHLLFFSSLNLQFYSSKVLHILLRSEFLNTVNEHDSSAVQIQIQL